METLAERLRYVLYKLNLSQVEAARLVGISQQSINYILRHNLETSRLAVKIAEGLQINPEWFLTGKGNWYPEKIIKIPIINDDLTLQLYFRGRSLDKNIEYVFTSRELGSKPFAVKVESNKLCICIKIDENVKGCDFLIDEYIYVNDDTINFSNNKKHGEKAYKIVEWRIYDIEV